MAAGWAVQLAGSGLVPGWRAEGGKTAAEDGGDGGGGAEDMKPPPCACSGYSAIKAKHLKNSEQHSTHPASGPVLCYLHRRLHGCHGLVDGGEGGDR